MKKSTTHAILPSALTKLVAPEADVHPPEPMEPGRPERVDYEYERLGTANLFFFVEPLTGWRHVEMTDHRTKIDYAHCIKWLVDLSIRMPNTCASCRIT